MQGSHYAISASQRFMRRSKYVCMCVCADAVRVDVAHTLFSGIWSVAKDIVWEIIYSQIPMHILCARWIIVQTRMLQRARLTFCFALKRLKCANSKTRCLHQTQSTDKIPCDCVTHEWVGNLQWRVVGDELRAFIGLKEIHFTLQGPLWCACKCLIPSDKAWIRTILG